MSRTDAQLSSEHRPLKVFFSYAHKDQKHREELEKSLAFLKHSGAILTWHDRKVLPGHDWGEAIDRNLLEADIILLLISADFANSHYCWDIETQAALDRHNRGEAKVVPIMIRPVEAGWSKTPIGSLQALPQDARPVTRWRRRDDAYAHIAAGVRAIIDSSSRSSGGSASKSIVTWSLKVAGESREFTAPRIQSIAASLRKAANSLEIRYVDQSTGSVNLQFEGPRAAFAALNDLQASGQLASLVGCDVLALSLGPGATLRIVSRVVGQAYESTIHYLPDVFGQGAVEDGWPPLVQGITIPLDNPLQIGWSLVTDVSKPTPNIEERAKLQTRLGRYLNTMLVLSGDHLNVDLNPLDPHCGLPTLLRNTELGRDMLAQDVVLKHVVASELHPSTPHGKAFWSEADGLIETNAALEACFRVWIVPGEASVHEQSDGRLGHVTLERLGLKVMSDQDYRTLERIRGGDAGANPRLLGLFQTHIVPAIQSEVSFGPRFGLLRQILSVLIMSKWIRESELGSLLAQAKLLDSNTPEIFGLVAVSDETILSLKQTYTSRW